MARKINLNIKDIYVYIYIISKVKSQMYYLPTVKLYTAN